MKYSTLAKEFRRPIKSASFHLLVSRSVVLFEDVGTPTALALWLMLKHGEYQQYLEYTIDPSRYLDSWRFRHDYMCAKIFSKSTIFPKVFDVRAVAMREFIRCERKCEVLNKKIIVSGFRSLFSDVEWRYIDNARRKISSILGDPPLLNDLDFHFGPGVNQGLTSDKTTITDKLMATRTITERLRHYLSENPIDHAAWDLAHVNGQVPSDHFRLTEWSAVRGSRLAFVPKNAKTDRPICVEPLYNSFVQTGIGSKIRSLLKRTGCNLRSQERNQLLARKGSIDNTLATIDMKSASDTISYMVVMEMIPYRWFDLLDSARSPEYEIQGNWYSFSKFSSMGNAYTFELQTLIFLCLARAIADEDLESSRHINAYGDDLIVPTSTYVATSNLLGKLGFEVNKSKSYHSGPFRESCGKDYFLGSNVRPLFLKGTLSPQQIYAWCNWVRRYSGGSFHKDPTYKRWYYSLTSLLPKGFRRIVGPDGYGDGHLIVPLSELPKRKIPSAYRTWECVGYSTFQSKPCKTSYDEQFTWCYALYRAQRHLNDVKPESTSLTYDSLREEALRFASEKLAESDGVPTRRGRYVVKLTEAFHVFRGEPGDVLQ